jgi:hypothetical protein
MPMAGNCLSTVPILDLRLHTRNIVWRARATSHHTHVRKRYETKQIACHPFHRSLYLPYLDARSSCDDFPKLRSLGLRRLTLVRDLRCRVPILHLRMIGCAAHPYCESLIRLHAVRIPTGWSLVWPGESSWIF